METRSYLESQDTVAMEQEAIRDKKEDTQNRIHDITRLSIKQKFILLFKEKVFLFYETRPGWRGSLPIYAFRCPRHGIQTDYPHGNYERLDCQLCRYSICEYPMEMPI